VSCFFDSQCNVASVSFRSHVNGLYYCAYFAVFGSYWLLRHPGAEDAVKCAASQSVSQSVGRWDVEPG